MAIHVLTGKDVGDIDGDSAYSGDDLSDTASIDTTIRNHRYVNGRRYHAFRAGSYWFVPLGVLSHHVLNVSQGSKR